MGLLGAVATLRLMPNLHAPTPRPFDWGGYALLASGMVTLSLALDGLGGMALAHALVAAGLLALTAYWQHARRHADPLFPPALLSLPSYRLGVLGNLCARVGAGAMTYLIPLLLQLALGFSPLHTGLLMLPMALTGLPAKRAVTLGIRRWGYRSVLVTNTLALGLLIGSFALITSAQPLWLIVLHMAVFGAVNAMQFTAMNTATLKDLPPERAASGNSLFSMVQMLGMSLGVSCAATLLQAFAPAGVAAQPAFAATLLTIGAMTLASAAIFWRLPDEPAPRKR